MKKGDAVQDGEGARGTVRDVVVREVVSHRVINGKSRPVVARQTEVYVDWNVRGTSR